MMDGATEALSMLTLWHRAFVVVFPEGMRDGCRFNVVFHSPDMRRGLYCPYCGGFRSSDIWGDARDDRHGWHVCRTGFRDIPP